MLKWVKNVLLDYTKKVHTLLVFDAFHPHQHETVIDALRQGNVQTSIIPPGCTSKVQPVDVSLNKPFKAILKHKWEEYMQDMAEKEGAHQKVPTPTKQSVVEWVIEANDYLASNAAMVSKSFKVCGISNALDGTENDLIHCAKELPTLDLPYGTEHDSDENLEDPFKSDSESSDASSECEDSD